MYLEAKKGSFLAKEFDFLKILAKLCSLPLKNYDLKMMIFLKMNYYLYAKLKPYLYGKRKRWSIQKLILKM
jgi:hypothetical protein